MASRKEPRDQVQYRLVADLKGRIAGVTTWRARLIIAMEDGRVLELMGEPDEEVAWTQAARDDG